MTVSFYPSSRPARKLWAHRRTFYAYLVLFFLLAIFLPTPALAYVDPSSGKPNAGQILRPFEAPKHKWSPGHRGVDLALAVGAQVRAAGDGVVAFSGVVAGKPVLSIDHPDGLRSTYQPIHSHLKAGDPVAEGQFIGTLGHSAEDHRGLHWGILTGKDSYMNPLLLLDSPIIRLKPLDERMTQARG